MMAENNEKTYQFVTREDVNCKEGVELTNVDLWDGLKERTTAHGIPHITQARGRFKKIFWIIIVTLTLAALIVNTTLIFIDFFRFDVNVIIEIKHEAELEYPAVTICNLNPIRKSSLYVNKDIENVLNKNTTTSSSKRRRKRSVTSAPTTTAPPNSGTYAADGRCCCSCCSCSAPTTTAPPTTTAFTGTTTTRPPPVVVYPDPDEETSTDSTATEKFSVSQRDTTENFKIQEQVSTLLANMPVIDKSPMGYYKEDFIVSCSYAGHNCYPSDFTSFYNSKYGNCFTFNSGWNKSYAIEKSFKPGPQYGLKLILNIQQDEYVGELGEAAGARVVIHSHDKMPFPEDEGFSVGPGLLTSAGITQVTIERKGGRYGECISDKSKSRNVFEEHYPVKYTNTACLKTCYQKELINVCKCADPQYPMKGEAFDNVVVSACDTTDVLQTECVKGVTEKFSNNTLECNNCKMPCIEKVYVPVVSSVLWPSEDHKEALFKEMSSASAHAKNIIENADPEKYKTNFLKLEVYFQEFNYEIIKQKPAYEDGNFLSDIGGVIGLWIGCSILSIFEFIEFFMDLFVLAAIKCRKRGKPSSTKVQMIDVQPMNHKNQQKALEADGQKMRAEITVPRRSDFYNKPNNLVIANSISKKTDNFNAETNQLQTHNLTKPVSTKQWDSGWEDMRRQEQNMTQHKTKSFKQVGDNTMIVRKVFVPSGVRTAAKQQVKGVAHEDRKSGELVESGSKLEAEKPMSENETVNRDQTEPSSKTESGVVEIVKRKTKLRKKLKKKKIPESSEELSTHPEPLNKVGKMRDGSLSRSQSEGELLMDESPPSTAETTVDNYE